MPVTATAAAPVRSRLIHHSAPPAHPVRMIDPDAWQATGVPLLRDPRGLVSRLHELHRPEAGTAVVAVLDATGRPVASASFAVDDEPGPVDGWRCRNIILAHLRMIVPDDLRRAAPVRTTVLLLCRDGERGWEPDDGRWMWGLRDACALHGLRCGAVVVLADNGWQVVGDGRAGRNPTPVTTPPPATPTPLPTTPPAAEAPTTPDDTGPGTPTTHSAGAPAPPSHVDQPDIAVAYHDDYPDGLGPPVRGAVVRLVPDVATALRCS